MPNDEKAEPGKGPQTKVENPPIEKPPDAPRTFQRSTDSDGQAEPGKEPQTRVENPPIEKPPDAPRIFKKSMDSDGQGKDSQAGR